MGISVGVNPPKTPVTKGSHGIAQNTIPNICKMPGPPAPFVPAPLPNIAKSELNPQGYSKTVEIEGNAVAIRGATFESIGDMASKGTGGGLISANCHGPAKFISPGSLTVQIEGNNVHQLSDMMLNNCGPGGSPPNTGATMCGGETQSTAPLGKMPIDCENGTYDGKQFDECEKKQICAKCAEVNKQAEAGMIKRRTPAENEAVAKEKADAQAAIRTSYAIAIRDKFFGEQEIRAAMYDDCAYDEKWKPNKDPEFKNPMFDPDHVHEVQLGGSPAAEANFKWMSAGPNRWMGSQLRNYHEDKYSGVEPNCCDG
jgi:hypothetical protein